VLYCPIAILAYADKNLAAEIHKVVGDYARDSIPISAEEGTAPSREHIEAYHTELSTNPKVVFAPNGPDLNSSAEADRSIIPESEANETLVPGQSTSKGPAASKEKLITIYLESSQLTLVTVHATPTMTVLDLEAIFRQRRFITQGTQLSMSYKYCDTHDKAQLWELGAKDGDVFVVWVGR
jgi:hypothetical protein